MRTIKDATVNAFLYAAIAELRRHFGDWLAACNFGRQLKALRRRPPMQAIAAVHARTPHLFVRPPGHLTPGPNIQGGQERAGRGHVGVADASAAAHGVVMPGPRRQRRARADAAAPVGGRAASAGPAAPHAGGEAPRGAPAAAATRNGGRRGRAGRGTAGEPDGALRDLLRGLYAGDLESVLLTVAMAAEENRMPSPDMNEIRRILDFLARLAALDAALPPHPDGAADAPETPPNAD